MAELDRVLANVRDRIARYRGQGIGESRSRSRRADRGPERVVFDCIAYDSLSTPGAWHASRSWGRSPGAPTRKRMVGRSGNTVRRMDRAG